MSPRPAAAPLPATTRLFLALWPGAAALRALAVWQARWVWPPGAAVVAPERLHLTLHYIGPVATSRLPELAHGLAIPLKRFELTLGDAELWPRGLAVLCPSRVPDALAALHTQLRSTLQRLDLPVDTRAFRPHVTLARKAAGTVAPADPLSMRWSVRGYALVQSQGGYRTLQHYR